jgi:hypothetical protein
MLKKWNIRIKTSSGTPRFTKIQKSIVVEFLKSTQKIISPVQNCPENGA